MASFVFVTPLSASGVVLSQNLRIFVPLSVVVSLSLFATAVITRSVSLIPIESIERLIFFA